MIRILIVDDHAIVRQGLKRVLGMVDGMEVVAEAANGIEAFRELRTAKPDIILLDISMPKKNGLDTLKQIVDGHSKTRVLILSMYPEDQYAVRLMKAGAAGYLTKDSPPEQLVDAIHKIIKGQKHISPSLAELLLKECSFDPDKPAHELLSDREYQILRLLGAGKKISEIAAELSLSAKTVSTYRSNILEKMKLKNNSELTFYVIENGLLNALQEGGL